MKQNKLFQRPIFGVLLSMTMLLAACQTATGVPTIPVTTVAPEALDTPTNATGPSVEVDDQMSDGKTVVVREVVSQGPGWIAIHRQNPDGSVGDAIGHAAVKGGDNRNVIVTVDPSQVTAVMYAMVHMDAGTVGVYEFPGPDAPEFANGVMVTPPFKWSQGTASVQTPSVAVVDQDVKSGVVMVAKVISNGAGWIVIQDKNPDGSPGKVRGYAPVRDGENQDVSVSIDPTNAGNALMAVLYMDVGMIGTFEGTGTDGPQEVSGQMVTATFNTSPTAMAMENPTAAATQADASNLMATPTAGSTVTNGGNSMTGMVMATPGLGDQSMVQVSDQPVISNTVTISDVISTGQAWVVIYNDNNYQPGEVIGYTAVNAGESKNIVVHIDASKATPTLYALLQVDQGIVGTYEFPGPDAPVMIGARMIQGAFRNITIQASGSTPQAVNQLVKVSDQEIRGGTVRIDEVLSQGPGWIGIHILQSDGTLGPPIGDAHVNDGVTKNLIVTIKANLATKVMYAMLHYDKGTTGVWEFPGPDAPVDGDMNVVMPSFHVTGGLATDSTVLKLGQLNGLPILVDGAGFTLYTSLMDSPGQSMCDADCRSKWIPLIVGAKLSVETGVSAGKLGLITLPDGSRQATYSGYPLYFYYADTKPGDTLGQGMDGTWFTSQP